MTISKYLPLFALLSFFVAAIATDQVKIMVAMKHSNLDKLDKLYWEIADPKSKNYAHYLSIEEIASIIGTPMGHIEEIKEWLHENGASKCKVLPSRDIMSCWASNAFLDRYALKERGIARLEVSI
jgi:hypothetical protein